ncbi:hypothetical protein HWV07_07785 [Natronomonas salina]|uniref:hypothetical protein n=1 Tax=Natronomonas salina TaxID=1710540 RepID=UPI0015B464AB|nr:hypothetical protein [Natronomonas salina]QLD88934.1 hypothetical protein HWV07_07785 [Natronomonas salina]
MRLRNSDGTPVDPVPFLVVALLGVMIAIAWGPLYLKSHGVGQPTAVTASVGLAAATVGSSYYRYVWTANPLVRRTVPAAVRFRKLVYAMVIGVLVVLALVALLHL